MATESLAFRNAEIHVQSYSAQSSLMAAHAEAMDCRDCEAFLQMGIDAFKWLLRADRDHRLAVYRGEAQFSPEFDAELQRLCGRWLVPCDFAEKWIANQLAKDFAIDNLEEFRNCVTEMQAIVNSHRGKDNLPEQIAVHRDSAIQEYRNGETAEFF